MKNCHFPSIAGKTSAYSTNSSRQCSIAISMALSPCVTLFDALRISIANVDYSWNFYEWIIINEFIKKIAARVLRDFFFSISRKVPLACTNNAISVCGKSEKKLQLTLKGPRILERSRKFYEPWKHSVVFKKATWLPLGPTLRLTEFSGLHKGRTFAHVDITLHP